VETNAEVKASTSFDVGPIELEVGIIGKISPMHWWMGEVD